MANQNFRVKNGLEVGVGGTILYAKDNGNIGIGTATPGSYSDSANNLVVANTSGEAGITIATNTTSYGRIFFADGTTGSAPYRGVIQYDHTNDALEFKTADANALYIDSSQRILIGATSTQSTTGINKLQVNSFAQAHGVRPYLRAGGAGNTNWIKIYSFSYNATSSTDSGNLSNVDIFVQGSTGNNWAQATLLVNRKQQGSGDYYDVQLTNTCGTFSLSGRVAYKYDAAGGTNSDGLLEVWVRPAYNYMATYVFPNSALPISGEFVCTDTGSETQPTGSTLLTSALYIDSSGRFGIGTDNPTQNLDINGATRFRGAIYDNNNVVGSAGSVLSSTGSGVEWISVSAGSDAGTLDGIDSTQFLRSDADDSASGVIDFLGGSSTTPAVRVKSGGNSWSEGLAIHPSSNNSYALTFYRTTASLTTNTNTWAIGNLGDNSTNNFGLIRRGLTGSSGIRADSIFDVTQSGTFRFGFTPTVGSNTIWHAGNHGSGSGLDADTLDGIQGGSFLRSDADDSTSGQITITKANNATTGGGQIYLNGTTGNRIDFNQNGVDVPTVTTRSSGTKLVLYPALSGTQVDYALGIHGNTLWYSVPTTSQNHRWYGGTTEMMKLYNSTLTVGGNTVWTAGNDGSGSGLDADLLDGQHGSYYQNASNLNTGTIPAARVAHNTFDIGDTTAETARNVHETGIYTFNVNNNNLGTGTQSAYYSVLAFGQGTGGSAQIAAKWTSSGDKLYYRSLRDVTDNWWSWKEIWHSGNDGSGSGLDADTVDGIQGASFLRSDAADTASGEILFSSARTDFGSSGDWNGVGFSNLTNIHVRDHNQFWFGAGNGTWFTGTANTKSQASGLAADAGYAHDLLISTMSSTNTFDRGITFAVDNTGAGNSGWRLGKWHSGDARDASKFVVDGQIFAKAGYTDEYDYYADDYSAYYSSQGGNAHWAGDSGYGWHVPGIVSSSAIQIQSGNNGTNSRKPQIQFHQYGYGGPAIEYDGPNDTLNIIGPTSRLSNTGFKQQGNTIWHAGNDGSGSGLDADTLDGIQGSSLLRSDTNDSMSASNGPVLSITKTGSAPGNNNTLLVTNTYGNHSWGITGEFRIENNSGTDRPSILFSSGFNSTTWSVGYGYSDDNFRIKTGHGHRNGGWGTTRFSIDSSGNLYAGELTNKIWHAGNDGSGSGLDADTLDGINSGSFLRSDAADTSSAMLTCYTSLTNNDDYFNSPISIRERGAASAGDGEDRDSPNLNFHWAGRVSKSFWMGANGYMNWGEYNSSGVPQVDGTFRAGNLLISSSSHQVWHAGNDGSGSGLDADTLDGYQFISGQGISAVGNFGQWQVHNTYTNFNSSISYWGWNYVQGSSNAPNSTSSQWYRNRVSLGSEYGRNYGSGDYWLEMAYPRFSNTSAGHMWVRTCEGGNVGGWTQVGANIIGNFTATGTVTSSSDARLKENITTIDNALSKVLNLRGVEYDRPDLEGSPHHIGVIAQEIEEIIPEVVSEDDSGYKKVAYGNLVGLLIEAIKEQQNKIDEYGQMIREQQNKIDELEQIIKDK